MKSKALIFTLIASLALVIGGKVEIDDENTQVGNWAREYHIPGYPSPNGIA